MLRTARMQLNRLIARQILMKETCRCSARCEEKPDGFAPSGFSVYLLTVMSVPFLKENSMLPSGLTVA